MTARQDGHEALALPDIERRLAAVVRDGTVMAVDHARRMVRVRSGEIETTWLPWTAGRAGAGKRRWDPPEVGEQVVMISPGGDLRLARVLPGAYSDAHDAPSSDGNKDVTEYGDGTVLEYDRATHTLRADLGDSRITASRTEVLLQVGDVRLSVTAAGVAITAPALTHNGVDIGDTHRHVDVKAGSDTTGVPLP